MLKKNIIKISIFICLFTLIFQCLTTLVKHKEGAEVAVDSNITEGFYAEAKNSLDVLYLGSSHVFCDISPLDIWNKYGITGYIRGSSVQKIWMSYYNLKDSLAYQSPKVVVLDVLQLFNDDPQSEQFNREALDEMRLSRTKIEAIQTSIEGSKDENLTSYIFPLIRYHSRWKELSDRDFMYFMKDKEFPTKGFLPRFAVDPVATDYSFMNTSVGSAAPGTKELEYLYKIDELCKEKGIKLLLIKTPTVSPEVKFWDGSKYLATKNIADKLGVEYIDDNINREEVNIDWSKETLDRGNHLNYYGAEKLSTILGKYLSSNYSLMDKRGDVKYDKWNQQYTYYEQCVKSEILSKETNISNYLDNLNNPNYIIIFAANSDVGINFDNIVLLKLQRIGLRGDLNKKGFANYMCVINNENNIFELSKDGSVDYYQNNIEGIKIHAISYKNDTGSKSSIKIDGSEYVKTSNGMNIVVYDKVGKKVVDSICLTDKILR